MGKFLKLSLLILILLGTASARWQHAPSQQGPLADVTNVILIMGDGMGPEHVRATSLYLGRPLVFETFPFRGSMTTNSAEGVTDSAAAATAMATGHRVNDEVISVDLPGDGDELPTVLEYWQDRGKATGLVTTSHVTDASPAAFAAHEEDRDREDDIALDYFEDSRPNVLLGGGGQGVSEILALAAGYTVVLDTAELLGLETDAVTYLSGQFGNDKMPPPDNREPLPTLAEMTETALDVLDNDPDGFFLMVEQEGTDTQSHRNDLEWMVDSVIELEEAVEVALEWADDREDTLIIVTADHETGGLRIDGDNGAGELPDVTWTADSAHTDAPVPIYARGPRAQLVPMVTDITLLYGVLGPGDLGINFDNAIHLPFFWKLFPQ